ncbi:MAG: hypothetical protein AB7K09_09755 [Planctomycetota bacterium]
MHLTSILCPDCREPLYAGDTACPSCKRNLSSQTREVLRRIEVRGGADSREAGGAQGHCAMGSRDGWLRVRDGIHLVWCGELATCIVLGVMVVADLLGSPTGGVLDQFIKLVWVVATLICIVGMYRCLATPEESGLRPTIIGAMVCLSLSSLFWTATLFTNAIWPDSSTGFGLFVIVFHTMSLVGQFLFMVFVADIIDYFGAYRIADSARYLNMTLQAFAVASLLWFVFGLFGGLTGPNIMFWGSFAVHIWYLRVVSQTRDLLTAKVNVVRFARAVMAER